jgi:hypothetical protein
MDTATGATKQRDTIQKKLTVLDRQCRETESALSRERATHGNLTAKRSKFLEELPGADNATEGYLHREIDGLESQLRISSRVAEGLSNSLARLTGERTRLHAEFVEVQEIAAQEKRAQAFTVFSTQIGLDRHAAAAALDAARSALFALNHTAVQGIKECGEQGRSLVGSVLEEFLHQQHNPEALLGWRSVGFELSGDLRLTVRPMVKGEPGR